MARSAAKQDVAEEAAVSHISTVLLLTQIVVSDTEVQVRRRNRFTENEINDLAESIRTNGLIQPITVRPVKGQPMPVPGRFPAGIYEIVAGERRYLAASKARLDRIDVFIRDLDDMQVLEIQAHENIHRKDLHPMDEAFTYKLLQEKLGCDVKELTHRVGKPEPYVLNRLKLNELIDEVQEDIEKGICPLSHALELSKFDPVTQKQIYDASFPKMWDAKFQARVPDKREPILAHKHVIAYISQKVLYQLSRAPFDRKATNLRDDGLTCADCTMRTGANRTLFDPKVIGRKDSCLNPTCFSEKADRHVQLTRAAIARDAGVEVSDVPLVNANSYSRNDESGVLSYYEFNKVDPSQAGKPGVLQAVSVAPETWGQVIFIRKIERQSGSETSSREKGVEKTPAEKEQYYRRREELFDVNVGEIVRKRVFSLAMEKFAENFSMSGGGNNFLPQLLAKLWHTSNNGDDAHTKDKVVQALLAEHMDADAESLAFSYDAQTTAKKISTLSPSNQARMLFLFVHGNKGAMYWPSYKSQAAVRELAEEYGIDYQLIDAEVRLDVCSKKAKPMHQEYLDALTEGKRETPVPRQFLKTYKAYE